jgi:hypothetical protein
MGLFQGVVIRGVEEMHPLPFEYRGRRVYTEAPGEGEARERLQQFAETNVSQALDIGVMSLPGGITPQNAASFYKVE